MKNPSFKIGFVGFIVGIIVGAIVGVIVGMGDGPLVGGGLVGGSDDGDGDGDGALVVPPLSGGAPDFLADFLVALPPYFFLEDLTFVVVVYQLFL